jgi:hypothetical protein
MFQDCAHIPGHYAGACGNCQRGGRGAHCSVRDVDGDTILDRDPELEMMERSPSKSRYPARERRDQRYPA